MAEQRTVNWYELDKVIGGLETDIEHEIRVQREAIPLIFVPGIMGSRLRRTGTDPNGETNGLPNMRWDPGKDHVTWMWKHYCGTNPLHRKNMLVGPSFDKNFLEVDNSKPIGDGFRGIMEDYRPFLEQLKALDWSPLDKIFEFPVYAFGYNWTDSSTRSGAKLKQRISDIINEARQITGLCERVILITHSMGGIVARAASELSGARDSILGIIHGVQPVTGAPAAYWRIKGGFEASGFKAKVASRFLGNSGPNVTAILGNIPGGLELLPNKLHRTVDGKRAWLSITEDGTIRESLPKSDPYQEIYRVPAVVRPTTGLLPGTSKPFGIADPYFQRPGTNKYWGLVDPYLLNPANVATGKPDPKKVADNNALANAAAISAWGSYLKLLASAESFHERLGKQAHPRTFCFRGIGHSTADVVELHIESNWVRSDSYPTRGFRGFFRNQQGENMQAVLQEVKGNGDGTVPVSSASAVDKKGHNRAFILEHQPAYENEEEAQPYTRQSIIALCKVRYDERRRKVGDFPARGGKGAGRARA